MVGVTNLLDAAYSGVLIAVWAQHRGGGAGLMGVTAAAASAGALIGAIAAATVGHRMPRRPTYTIGFLAIGLPRFAVLALDAPLWLILVVLFVGGIGGGVINPILGAVKLERVPEHLRGRVMSLTTSLAWALIPFGGLVGGVLSEQLGHQHRAAGVRHRLLRRHDAARAAAGVEADEPRPARAGGACPRLGMRSPPDPLTMCVTFWRLPR